MEGANSDAGGGLTVWERPRRSSRQRCARRALVLSWASGKGATYIRNALIPITTSEGIRSQTPLGREEDRSGVTQADLPDSLIHEVFGHLNPGKARSVLLVCKRFNACFFTCAALWRHFAVDPQRVAHFWPPTQLQWLEGRHALLRRVARHVTWFELRPGLSPQPFDRLAAMLRELAPDALRTLWLLCEDSPPPALFHLASRASQLTALDVRGRALPATAADALRALPLLRSMSWCSDAAFPPPILAAIASLAQLTKLSLVSSVPLPAEQAHLTTPTALQDLTLMVERPGADWAPPPPSSFAGLRAYKYDCQEGIIHLAGAELRSCKLSALSGRLCDCCGGDVGGGEVGGEEPPMLLLLHGLRRLPPLGPLLAALQPPGGGPIRRLKTQGLGPELVAANGGGRGRGGRAAARPTAWPVAGVVPRPGRAAARGAAAAGARGALLRRGQPARLHHQPAGPAAPAPTALPPRRPSRGRLAGREVDLYGNALQRLPPALAAATGLSRLVAAANPLGLQQPDHDPLAVLQQLPRLRELCLASTGIDGLPGGAWLSGLEDLDLRRNDLATLPEALTAATALTRLSLSGNPLADLLYIHRPSDATLLPLVLVLGAESMVSDLPRLVKLELAGVGHLTEDCLQGAVPRLAEAREAGRRAAEAGEPPLP